MSEGCAHVIGGFQRSDRQLQFRAHPALAMAAAALGALEDAGIVDLTQVDALACVEPLSWTYENLAQSVASEMGLQHDVEPLWVPAGGTSPQDLLHTIVARMQEGSLHCAVICGAESMRSRKLLAAEGSAMGWPEAAKDVNPMRGQGAFTSELEVRHGLKMPIQLFPLYENALRSRFARSAQAQIDLAAHLLAANAQVAADNEHAWFRDAPTAAQISTVSSDNRMIVYPYTKRMNAIMNVDQCAAVVVVSDEFAQAHGLLERGARVLGGAGAEEIWNPIERPDFSRCAAMEHAIAVALDRAGVAAADLHAADLYSCFPSAVQLAQNALAVEEDLQVTLTGGLAYAGGPGNAYVLHSLAAALTRLRMHPEELLLVTGIGMANTKHAATVLGGAASRRKSSGTATMRESLTQTPKTVVDCPDEPATVHTWTLEYDRSGQPETAILLLDLADDRRTIANLADTSQVHARLLSSDPVGRAGRVTYQAQSGRNTFDFD